MWFHFLIAHWQVLPEDIRQQVKAYDVLQRAAQIQTSPSTLTEIQSLERELKQTARHYGWGG